MTHEKNKIVSLVSLFLILSLSACDFLSKEQVFVNLGEIGVYYDDSTEKLVVLNSGNHNISKKASLYIYSLKVENINERILVVSKDGKELRIEVNYWFSLNPKMILKLHREVGENFVDRIIKPTIRKNLREVCGKYSFDLIKSDQLEAEMMLKLQNDVEFSNLITTKSFLLEIEPYKN